MSRDPYGPANLSSASGGNRSPRSARRGVGELPTVDRSPSRSRGSPIGRKGGRPSRSGAVSPDQHAGGGYYGPSQSSSSHHHHQQSMGSPYYGREEELGSPVMMDERGRSTGTGGGHHRSRSASRPAMSSGSNPMSTRYQSLDRGMMGVDSHDREFMPIREPRERSLDRSGGRERSLERGMYMEDEMYGGGGGVGGGSRSARQSPNPHMMSAGSRDASVMYIDELQSKNNDLQRELANFKKELELTNQKLGSSMHSIKTFWSPELKKERALRKEESAKYSLINDQLKLLNSENQKQAMLVRQLEEELRMRMRNPSVEVQQQIEMLYAENEHLTREVAILRETIKELELRIETQKQTLQARDESIKKLLEMLQNKGVGGKMLDEERLEFEARLIESENRIRHYETLVRHRDQELNKTKRLDEFRAEIQRRDQEILAMSAKMKTLEEQHQDYQRHIAVLKESLCAKEEHYNMLQADVEELRQRLEEKNRVIEKKTLTATQATQERNRLNNELNELRDHMDIKDRKINVLQRKLDLHEANRKLANGAAKAGEETTALKMQLDEQKKQLEEQRRKLDEHKKGLDSKSRQLEEKEKSIAEIDQKLKKRKEKMDQLEAQLQKQGAAAAGGRGGDAELQKRLAETQQQLDAHQKELEKTREDAQRSQAEMERLLQLVQMSQEEQNTKEKMIHDLQQALKNAQAELRNQRSASAQMRDEAQVQDKAVGKREQQYEQNIQKLFEEVEMKDSRVAELEQDVRELEDALAQQDLKKSRKICRLQQEVRDLENSLIDQNKVAELMEQVNEKTDRIVELEEQVQALEAALKDLHVESKKELWEDLQEKLNRKEERILALEKELKEFEEHQDACKNNSVLDVNKELESKTIQIEELKEEVNSLEAALKTQREDSAKSKEELKSKTHRIAELEGEVTAFEKALRDHSHMAELEELVGVVRQKDERIEELEEALRQSVRITAERENVLRQEEERRKHIMEKVGKLEQRLLSLQTAHALRCSTCRPLLTRLQELEKRLTQLLRERRGHLQDLAQMKQEALEAAISEKDAHLALLEVSGIRNARQAEQVDKLQADRKRLMEKLKEENERSMKLLQEYTELEPEPLPSNILVFDETEDHQNISNIQRSPSSRHNGHSSEHEVDQDSLEAVSPGSTPPPT